jgi:hypothetical protein
MRSVRYSYAPNVLSTINVKEMKMKKSKKSGLDDAVLFALVIILATLVLYAVPSYPAQFKCEAGGYTKVIEIVNKWTDYTYPYQDRLFQWHIEDISHLNSADDWLLISDPRTTFSITWPSTCEPYKGE